MRSPAWMPTTLARRKEVGQDPQGFPIGGIVEGRHEHDVVADIEVQVARGADARRRSGAAAASGSARRAAGARAGHASPASAPGSRQAAHGCRRGRRARRRRRRCRAARNAPRRRRGRAYRRPRCRRRATGRARLPAPAAGRARSSLGTDPGLRACSRPRRHCSVVSSSPCPFTSMLPPLRELRGAVRPSSPRQSRTGACRAARQWPAATRRRAARRGSAPSR